MKMPAFDRNTQPVYALENYYKANDFLNALRRSRDLLRFNELHDLRHIALRGYLDEAWAMLRQIIEERGGPTWTIRRS